MTVWEAEVRLNAVATNPAPKTQMFYRNVDGVAYIQGVLNTRMSSTASMIVSASTIGYYGVGTSSTGTNSITPAYPSSTSGNDLILFAGGSKIHQYGFTNANFKRYGRTTHHIWWLEESDATARTNNYNTLGTNLGPVRCEHHMRILPSSASGTETFTTSSTSNYSAGGALHGIRKSSAKEWQIISLSEMTTSDNLTSWIPSTATTEYLQIYMNGGSNQLRPYQKITNAAILGIGVNDNEAVLVTTATELWRSPDGYTWIQITHPFSGTNATRVRCGNKVWIMVGASGKIGRSVNNGTTWSVTQPFGTSYTFYGCRYLNGRWFVFGSSGFIATSDDDGQNWTQRSMGTSQIVYDVAWHSGVSVTDGYPDPANNGYGYLRAVCASWYMYESNDMGDTWSASPTDEVNSPTWSTFRTFGGGSPLAIYPTREVAFRAVGSKLGDIYDNMYYQNALTHGYYARNSSWDPQYSGLSYGNFYIGVWGKEGKFAFCRDADALIGENGYTTIGWLEATSLYNGVGTNPSATYRCYGYYDQEEYAVGYGKIGALPGDHVLISSRVDINNWNTYAYYSFDEVAKFKGGNVKAFYGNDNGEISIEYYPISYPQYGYPNGEGQGIYYYNGLFGIVQDGDYIVFTLIISDLNISISNVSMYYSWNNFADNAEFLSTEGYGTFPYFTTPTLLSDVVSSTGDNVRTMTWGLYAVGDARMIAWEYRSSYGVTSPDRYQWLPPNAYIKFDTTGNSVQINSGYAAVVTIIRDVVFPVEMVADASLVGDAIVKKVGIEAGAPGHTYTAHMTVDAFVEKNTTPAYLGSYSAANETAGQNVATYVYSPSTGLPAGTLVVVMTVCDNASNTTPTISVADQQSNTWTQLGWVVQGNGKAADGTVVSIHYSHLTTALAYSNWINVLLSDSVTCKGTVYLAFGGFATVSERSAAVTNTGNSATPTVTSGTVNSGDLVLAVCGVENSTTPTADSDTYNGNWASYIAATGTGGNAATHQSLYAAYKITNGSGAQTFNPTTSPAADWAEIIGVIAVPIVKQTAAVMRTTAAMTVETVVNKSYSTTAPMVDAVADLTADANVEQGEQPVFGASATAHMTTLAERVQPTTVETMTAVAEDMYVFAPDWHTAQVSLDAVADVTTDAKIAEIHNTDVTFTATVDNPPMYVLGGYEYSVTVDPTTASFSALGSGIYTLIGADPDDPTRDPDPPVEAPTPLPGTEGWHTATSVYGSTGRTGNLVELTNRHYQDAYRACCEWPEWPFPNGPGGFLGMGYLGVYTMGARASAVTPLGNDRFLVTWAQENWVQYYLDWTGWGDPVQRVLLDVPMILVATVLDCSGDGDPVIESTTRYDMPLGWRWYRNGYGQSAQPMGNGKVACTFSGFMIIPDDYNIDYGNLGTITEDSANIVCKIDASGAAPVFEWVTTFGGEWNDQHSFINEVMVHNNDVLITRYGYVGASVVKFDGSTGSYLGTSSVITALWDNNAGRSTCIYDGDDGYLIGDNTLEFIYRKINLSTLSWEASGSILYKDGGLNLDGNITTAKKGSDGKWYCAGALSDNGIYSVFKIGISDGVPVVESIHRSSVPNVKWFSEDTLFPYNNAYRTYNWTEVWVPYNYTSNVSLYSQYTKQNFCPGAQNPSVVGAAAYLTNETGQYPEHQKGPQVVAGIPPMNDDYTPAKPKAWISYPAGESQSNWSHYFADGRPEFCADMDCAELSNGKILVVMAGVEDLLDAGEDANGNGIYRIFSYIVDPQDDPPPLKLSQRDDDKKAGAARIGYDPQQESTIRAGWVAW